MFSDDMISDIELIYIVVNPGVGSKVLHFAKEQGIKGGTVFLGKGTVHNSVLNFLALYDERKEIVLMAADKKTADRVIDLLDKKLQFEKPNHGIAFTTNVYGIAGTRGYRCDKAHEERGVNNEMYQLIMAIVKKGRAEDVIDVAAKVGSKGGTIINARGSGIHETSKVFSMDIEPEKEIVMILSAYDNTDNIINSIRRQLNIDEPGNGIIFTQNVNKVFGLYE